MDEFSNPEPSIQETKDLNLDTPNSSEKQMAMLSHLGGLAGFLFPFGNIIIPLVIWLSKKDSSSYIAMHGLESLNFQISLTIAAIVAGFLCFLIIGFFILPVICVLGIVFPIIAAIKANDGFDYRYPMTVRLVS